MDRSKRRLVWRAPTLLAVLGYLWGADPDPASGQVRVQIRGGRAAVAAAADEESEESRARVHPPTDRILARGMRRAEESISGGEFADALRFVDEVLGGKEDYFVETDDVGGFSGLKEAARRLIRDLPPEGRRAYESTYAPIAERQLREAAADGNAAQLEAIVQRYFFTPAGYQAALLLATQASDAGRHLSAALLYQQLLDTPAAAQLLDPALSIQAAASWLAADDAERARQVLDALATRGRATIEIGGRQHSLDGTNGSLEWLRSTVGEPADVATTAERQWLTYRGNVARNGETAGGLPHMRVRWNVRLLSPYPKLEELFEEYQANLVQSNRSTSVASAPLAVGDYIIVRSPHGVLAVDFRTGKRIWRSEQQRDHELETLVRSGGQGDDLANAEPAKSFARRMWEDFLFGVVSSDGSRVFAIRDLPMPSPQDYEMQPIMSMAGTQTSAPSNRLSAYDLATEGSLVWEIDGAAVKGDLAGAFFLGAPVAVGPSLYVLLEIRDDVYLAALDRATGALQWRQQLANLETGVLLDIRRRLQSAMPSYDAGMLVCPTGAGLVVGIDPSKRSLAWAYRYETSSPFDENFAGGYELARQGAANRWTDNAALIVDGRVLITPPESDELHCLDLRTGRVLWKYERGEMYTLAGVDDGRVLLVGSRKLAALNLDDGKPAWEQGELALPSDAAPAGQGFFSAGRYYFPLTSAEVVSVDVARGAIASRVRARDGAALGNLICYRGTVISQNGLFLDCFDQVDALRARSEQQLTENAKDVAALRSLGEIAYNEGRLSEAIDLEERAYREAPEDLETRDMLAECLTEALDGDFASYQTRLPLLRELERSGAVNPLQVLRIEAQGQLAAGDPLASVEACLKLYRIAGPGDEPLAIGRDQQTNVARWVQAQVVAAWDVASVDQRESISTELRREAPPLDDKADRDKLERFLAFFGELPEFDAYKLAFARRLDADQRPIEAQQLYLDLVDSADATLRGEAVARVAAGLHAASWHMAAREYDRQLGEQFANQQCLDGATGRELLESWADKTKESSIDWPTGRVDVRNAPNSEGPAAARARAPVWSVRLEHSDSILNSGAGFLAARGELTWHDGLGRQLFAVGSESESQDYGRQTGSFYGVSRGNLLVLSFGRELVAFNTLPAGEDAMPPLIWRTSLASNFDAQDDYSEEMARETPVRPGSLRAPRATLDGKWLGVIGPVTSGGCVIQDQRRLMCVNQFTGAIQWSRTDVPPGSDLFGDERYVFATPVGKNVARVYSAIDGRSLGKAKVGPWDERLTTRGRRVIRWSPGSGGKKELVAIDPLADEPLWRHEFDAATLIDLDRDRYAALVERSGRAVVIDVETGEKLLDQPIPAQTTAEQIHLMTSDRQFVLVVQHPVSHNTDREVQPLGLDSPVVDGQVFAFDRKSGTMPWSRPAGVQQQALVLDQPPELPFLTFAGTLSAPNGGEGRESLTMLLLDKETGRTLFRSDELAQLGAGNTLGRVTDAANHEVTIEMAGRSLTVRFTDGRRPPEPPAMAEVESSAKKLATGIMGIFRSLGGAN